MIETTDKPSLNSESAEARKVLFQALNGVLGLAHKKIHSGGNSDSQKRAWCRVLIQGVSAYGHLLHDVELEGLEVRVKLLEERKNE